MNTHCYPKQAVRVLGKDGVSPVVRVRVWHSLYPCSQQLIPQQGSVRHGICRRDGQNTGLRVEGKPFLE